MPGRDSYAYINCPYIIIMKFLAQANLLGKNLVVLECCIIKYITFLTLANVIRISF